MAETAANHMSTTYLRAQGDRCQRLSRNCMDLGIARDLRLMAQEYFDASDLQARSSVLERH
ncbi:MAG: hypothetical protein QOD40_3125 [Alphaproteobacteria bacterium]|jgi:hypothetical protein|nr:hypothetical protein [Alphaproteobacteria bacterium]MEA2994205.1 hypothetical protein [Alphaproteobacteria bacterium]